MKYQTKREFVEAEIWNGRNRSEIGRFMGRSGYRFVSDGTLLIQTDEGWVTVQKGEYVIKDAAGKFSKDTALFFNRKYEQLK